MNIIYAFLAIITMFLIANIVSTPTKSTTCIEGVQYFSKTLTPVYDSNSLNPLTCSTSNP
jgi:hypothetical protein